MKNRLLLGTAFGTIAPALLTVTLPVALNNQLGVVTKDNGSKIVYNTLPYDLIDFELSAAAPQYYWSYQTGNDSNNGLTPAAAFKTLTHAYSVMPSGSVLNLLDDYVGLSARPVTSTTTINGKIKVKGKSTRTIFLQRREAENVSTFAWAASGGSGAYVSTASRCATIRYAMFDGNFRDSNGIPTPITVAASAAACQSTPFTFFWDGTSSLYVHMGDGRTPDPDNGWIYGEIGGHYEVQQTATDSTGIILYENCEFFANEGTATGYGCLRYRPVTTGSPNGARFGVKNCLFYGSSDAGLQIYDGSIAAIESCVAAYNHADGFNYHSFVTTGTKGAFITVYENNCKSYSNGFTGFAGQPAVGTSSNCTTGHDSINFLITNGDYHDSNGAVVAYVNGAVTVGMYISSLRPTGTANPKACYWQSGTGAGAYNGMYLYKCSANDGGDSRVKLLDSSGLPNGEADGQIYINGWLGEVNDAQVIGSLKDWNGNPTTLAAQAI